MKRKRYKIISAAIIAALITGGLFLIFAKERQSTQKQLSSTYTFSAEELEQLQDGDIVLRLGYGFVSENIAKYLSEKYTVSHCGIIVKSAAGKYYVIHSVSGSLSEADGVQVCSLNKFCKESVQNSLMVTRIKETEGKQISKRAKYYLSQKVPFDHAFNLEESSKIYCSELLWKILQEACMLDIYPIKGRPDELKFGPLYNPDKFDIIINHQLPLVNSPVTH